MSRLPRLASEGPEGDPSDRTAWLEQRVAYLERRLQQSNLYSESFLTRAFTVWGHYFVAHLLIFVPLFILALCAGLLGR
jgi:hypothetical protein